MSAVAATTEPSRLAALWSRIYWAVSDALVVTRRHLLHIPQTKEQLLSATVQPIMFVLLFRYVFGGAIQTPGMSYVNFLMAGIFVQTIVMEGMTGAIGLANDLQRGIIDRFRTLPMAPSAVPVGPVVADLLRNLMIIVVILSIGIVVGFRPDARPVEWMAAVSLLLIIGVAMSWVGTLVALIVRDPEAVQVMAFVVLVPFTFASGAFVPVSTMPGWLQPIVSHQPVTVVVDAIRSLLLGVHTATPLWQAYAWCAALIVAAATASIARYRYMMRG